MIVRKSTRADLEKMLTIYAYAREQMRKNGNPTQWGEYYPAEELLIQDIAEGVSYVIENEGEICGTFVFKIGIDPTYVVIENGHWLNDKTYGVIHRVASNGTQKGVLQASLTFAETQIENIRIDTHENNKIMQHLLEKMGYCKCGTVYIDDGSPRIAYQKEICSTKENEN